MYDIGIFIEHHRTDTIHGVYSEYLLWLSLRSLIFDLQADNNDLK